MRILVISDEHGDSRALQQILELEDCSHVFCLGDGVRDYQDAQDQYADRTFHIVVGNCDWMSFMPYPAVNMETIAGKRILYMHGHLQNVKESLDRAVQLGIQDRADVILYGHTHIPYEGEEEGILIGNPGSLANGDYAILTIENDEVSFDIKEM